MRGNPLMWRRSAVVVGVLAALIAAGVAATVAVGAPGKAGAKASPLKIAFVYNGTIDNQGWDTAWELSRLALQTHFGNKIQTTFKQGVPDGPQVQQVFQSLIQQGYKVIVSTSFGQQRYTYALAKANPKLTFFQVEGLKSAPNVATTDLNAPSAMYVAGMGAAAAAKGNAPVLGVVGGFPLTTQMAAINAWELGAQQIKPKATTRVVWTNNWDSIPLAENAAQAFVNNGVGALTELTTGPSIPPVADKAKIPYVSYEADQRKYGPQQFLTAVVFNWAPFLIQQTGDVLAGKFKAGFTFPGFKEGAAALAPWGPAYKNISAADKAKIQAVENDIKSGKFHLFQGPIVDRHGKTHFAGGKYPDAFGIEGMNFIVKGIVGVVPGEK